MITPAANSAAVSLHLAEWHQRSRQLQIPDNVRLLALPPYTPESNPMENVWKYLRENKLCAPV